MLEYIEQVFKDQHIKVRITNSQVKQTAAVAIIHAWIHDRSLAGKSTNIELFRLKAINDGVPSRAKINESTREKSERRP